MFVLKEVFGYLNLDLSKLNFSMKSIVLIILIILGNYAFSQNEVSWSIAANNIENDHQNIEVIASIKDGWHLYSVNTPKSAGPIPISVVLDKCKFVKLKSAFVEKSQAIQKFDANFDSDVFIFEDEFRGELEVKVKKDTTLSVTVTYMVCNEIMCLPPIDETLHIKLNINE
jgi:hypothetical protein